MQIVYKLACFVAISALAGCSAGDVSTSDRWADESTVDEVHQALTWQGEQIEFNESGSNYTTYYMYTIDLPAPSSICGSDGNDYILHFNRAGAYANRAKLRLDAESIGARCYFDYRRAILKPYVSTRVYDDNHIWMCVGKVFADWCGGTSIFNGLKVWQLP